MTRLHLTPGKLAAVVAGLADGLDARCQAPPATLPGRMAALKTKTNPLGSGRTPRAGEASTKIIGVRVTDAERVAFQAAADAAAVSLGEWVRRVCAAAAGKASRAGRSR